MQGLLHCCLRFCQFTGFQCGPCHGVSSVNIAPYRVFCGGQVVRCVYLTLMVGIEESELTIIEEPVDRAELRDCFHQCILRRGSLVPTCQGIEITKRRHEGEVRHYLDDTLILHDSAGQIAAGRPHPTQGGHGTKESRKGCERVTVVLLGSGVVAAGKSRFAQLPATPGHGLALRWQLFKRQHHCSRQILRRLLRAAIQQGSAREPGLGADGLSGKALQLVECLQGTVVVAEFEERVTQYLPSCTPRRMQRGEPQGVVACRSEIMQRVLSLRQRSQTAVVLLRGHNGQRGAGGARR